MKNNEKRYSVLKAVSWYTVGNVFVKSISFFVLPFLSSLLSTKDYGIYTAFLSTSTILDSIIIFGLTPTIRMAKFDEDTDYDKYTSSIVFVPVVISFIISVIINILYNSVPYFMTFDRNVWNWMMMFCATNAICLILSNRLILDGKYKAYFVYLLITTLSSIGLFFLFVKMNLFPNAMYLDRIVGQLLGNVLSIIFLIIVLGYKGFNFKYIKTGLLWGAPLIVHTFVISLFEQADTQMISRLTEFSELGVFGMATTLSLIPATLEASFESAWSPWFYNKMNSKASDTKKAINTYILIFTALLIEFMLISPDVIRIMTHKDYWGCIYFLLPMTINYFIEMIYIIPLNIQYFHKNTKNVMLATIISTCIEILLVIVFIKMFGIYGAVYAKTISKIILVLIHNYSAKRVDSTEYFDMKNALLCGIILFVFDALVLISKDLILVRALLFIIVLIFLVSYVYKNKDYLLKVFNGE